MKIKIKDFLMDQFDGRPNEFNEEIVSLIIMDNDIYIDTEFVINMKITRKLKTIFLESTRESQLDLIKEKLIENCFMDSIGENFVTAFYWEYIENLSLDDFLNTSEFVFEYDGFISIYIDMQYVMKRSKIENIMKSVKMCA